MKKKKSTLMVRRLTDEEKAKFRAAYFNTFGKVGRPPTPPEQKKKHVSIKLDPIIIEHFKALAKKNGKRYQTLINETLIKAVKKAA